MEMYCLDIIHILLVAVTGMPHIANHVSRRDIISLLESFRVGPVLPKMRIIIIALLIKAADTNPPPAIAVPAERLHITRLDCDDRCTKVRIKPYIGFWLNYYQYIIFRIIFPIFVNQRIHNQKRWKTALPPFQLL